MARRHFRLLLFAGVVLLVWATGFAAAQSDDADAREDTKTDDAAKKAAGDDTTGSSDVYTTDYLKKRFAEQKGDTPGDVITNESLSEQADQAPQEPSAAYTNEDLQKRFGSSEPSAEPTSTPPAATAETTEETPAVTEPGEPPLPPEERARRIAEIDAELKRLEKRLVAVRNPLLAGTAQPTEEERAAEQGLDNAERLRQIEAKMDELKATLEELRTPRE